MGFREGLRYIFIAARKGYPAPNELIKTLEPNSPELRYAKLRYGIGSAVFAGLSMAGLSYSMPHEVNVIEDIRAGLDQQELPSIDETLGLLLHSPFIALEALMMAHGLAHLHTARNAGRQEKSDP